MNNNYFHWKPVVPAEIVDNGSSCIVGQGMLMVSETIGYTTWHNVDLVMSRSSNNNNNPPDRSSQHYSGEGSSRGYNSSNWTTNENRVRKPPPQ